jgi:hypothetical protein
LWGEIKGEGRGNFMRILKRGIGIMVMFCRWGFKGNGLVELGWDVGMGKGVWRGRMI